MSGQKGFFRSILEILNTFRISIEKLNVISIKNKPHGAPKKLGIAFFFYASFSQKIPHLKILDNSF